MKQDPEKLPIGTRVKVTSPDWEDCNLTLGEIAIKKECPLGRYDNYFESLETSERNGYLYEGEFEVVGEEE